MLPLFPTCQSKNKIFKGLEWFLVSTYVPDELQQADVWVIQFHGCYIKLWVSGYEGSSVHQHQHYFKMILPLTQYWPFRFCPCRTVLCGVSSAPPQRWYRAGSLSPVWCRPHGSPATHAEGPVCSQVKRLTHEQLHRLTNEHKAMLEAFWFLALSILGQYLVELALRNAVTVVDDSGGFEAGWLVELDEQLPHHGSQVLDDVLAVLLHPYCSAISAGMGIHTANNLHS